MTALDDTAHLMIPALDGDGVLYPVEKMDAHRRAVPHLAVSIFVFDGDAMLLQRRANTCCSHPHWGESLPAAASRRLKEELGFSLPLVAGRDVEYRADVGKGLVEHEHVTFFTARAPRRSIVLAPDPAEVMETRWANWAEVSAEIAQAPERYAPWFRIYMERFPGFAV
jgi:isopentenyl-diphosphate Delta-isomerase